eukprot:m.486197 g.486197  ORF g.486197 m.486197 type:complete len:156 (-) comp21743_c1_seq14:2043-2510(-)
MTTLARTWHGLGSPPTELRVVDTLLNGQCFGWHMRPPETAPHPELIGVVGDKVVGLREMPKDTLFTCYNKPQMNPTTLKDALSNYFQLHIPLQYVGKERYATENGCKVYPWTSDIATGPYRMFGVVFVLIKQQHFKNHPDARQTPRTVWHIQNSM